MRHLHLPIDHSDADVALAAGVATAVGSAELFEAWTYAEGPGGIPELEAVIREERPVSPFAEVCVAIMQSVVALWQALVYRPQTRAQLPAPEAGAVRRLEEPSA